MRDLAVHWILFMQVAYSRKERSTNPLRSVLKILAAVFHLLRNRPVAELRCPIFFAYPREARAGSTPGSTSHLVQRHNRSCEEFDLRRVHRFAAPGMSE